ncbi:YncE family protein [Flavobacterium sp. FlaQc-50]
MEEIKQIPVADGPGMISFSNDGKLAYVGSSFTAVVEVVNTATYEVVKRIPVVSPFSPNIFNSPDGKLVALTHKDIGKVSVINTENMSVVKVIDTGAITNHVTFNYVGTKLIMYVTVGGENKVKVFDVADDYKLINNITVGALPHGLWSSPDGKFLYVGLEFADKVQAINTETMTALPPVQIGQSPQALVYAANAVSDANNNVGLKPLNDVKATQVIELKSVNDNAKSYGTLAVRSIGLADLVEQSFTSLQPNKPYTLALTKSLKVPYNADYEINTFTSNEIGKYAGQSTGLIKKNNNNSEGNSDYKHVILIDKSTGKAVLIDKVSGKK